MPELCAARTQRQRCSAECEYQCVHECVAFCLSFVDLCFELTLGSLLLILDPHPIAHAPCYHGIVIGASQSPPRYK